MATMNQPFSAAVMLGDVISNRWLRGLLMLLMIAETYSHLVLPSLISVEKAREQAAVAENARAKLSADAGLLEQQALVERERARNAALLKQAEAEAATAQADINREELVVQQETARQSERLQRAIADNTETDAAISRASNLILQGGRNLCISCFVRH